jgi:adenylate cyclase
VARLTYAGWIDDWAEGAREACAAARKAVETDPENGTALAVAAFTIAALGGGLDETVELANRALRLHPNSSTVCTNCAWVFTYGGEYGKALDLLDTARRLNPLDPRGYLMNNATAVAYFFAGHFEETERWTRRSLEKWPAVPVSLRYRAAALVHLGRVEEARAIISNLLSIQPNSTLARSGQIRHSDPAKLDMYLDALRQAGLPE